MIKPKYKIGDKIRYTCKYKNEIVCGEIIAYRPSNLNWDYKVRYQVYTDFEYIEWIEEKYIIDKIK